MKYTKHRRCWALDRPPVPESCVGGWKTTVLHKVRARKPLLVLLISLALRFEPKDFLFIETLPNLNKRIKVLPFS